MTQIHPDQTDQLDDLSAYYEEGSLNLATELVARLEADTMDAEWTDRLLFRVGTEMRMLNELAGPDSPNADAIAQISLRYAMRRAAVRNEPILVIQKSPMQATSAMHAVAVTLGMVTMVIDADRTNLNDLIEDSPLRERALFAGGSDTPHAFIVRGIASMMADTRMRTLNALTGARSRVLLVVDEPAEPAPGWTLCDLRG